MYSARVISNPHRAEVELPAAALFNASAYASVQVSYQPSEGAIRQSIAHTKVPTHTLTVSAHSSKAANMSNQMAHILQAMPSGVVIIDGDGVVTLANPVATELLGRPLLGARWFDIIHRAFAPQDDDGHEVSLKNGRRVKLAITPLAPEPGQLIVLTDLTETRLLQKNLSHLQRLSSLGKMVATLAHQVRTPLSAALLYASNLASPKLTDAARHKFQSKLVDRLNELERQVNDMLLMAKGRQDSMAESVTMDDIITHVMASCEPIADKKQCQLEWEDSSHSTMLANVNALSSAVNNLVMNSIEAGATKIKVSASETKDGLLLDVIDNGKGLDPAMQKQVLEPFFTTKSQGTGLGLAVVQSVVRNHGGQIQLSCKPGMGCHIRLFFPHAKHAHHQEVTHG
ncbi:HAMP domain-containing histidine kinase [Shewanella basaltis]|uniref:sensor histidine kinase n=1 Tax=Shewanella basaltis TaxID=472183 RepID=UPI00200ECF79|nr:HAMP domain-containing sensor histidine kinase [Shewanella basaltis]MCL1112569.1 HAMP domain-containing histidine kinase [Shewanella basaltis]